MSVRYEGVARRAVAEGLAEWVDPWHRARIMTVQPVKGMTAAEIRAEAALYRRVAEQASGEDAEAYRQVAEQIDRHAEGGAR